MSLIYSLQILQRYVKVTKRFFFRKFRTEALKITSCTHHFYLIQESTIRLHTRLSQLGFDIKKEKIFSSLSAAKAVVAERQLNPLLILEEAAKEVIKNVKLFC